MNKYTSRKYAKALTEAILAKEPQEPQKIISNFLALLQRNGDVKKAKEIIALAGALILEKEGNKKVTLQTARKIKNIGISIAKKGDVVVQEVNADLIAGVKVIINNEKQLDFSLKKKMQEIFS